MSSLPRPVHPGAWWLWALGLGAAASRTTNPLVLASILAVVGTVVAARRTETRWGRAFRGYLLLGAAVVVIRVVFRMVLSGGSGEVLLVRLPVLSLPDWLTGIAVGGDVTLTAVLAGFYDGLRLATIIICVGAANALADPKRLLRSVPGALYEAGTVLVVSATILAQLADSVQRVRQARRLRGSDHVGLGGLRSLVVPVLEDAFERSLRLAAAMDTRGYGRTIGIPAGYRRITAVLVLGGLLAVSVGAYALLDPTGVGNLGAPFLLGGVAASVVGLWFGGKRVPTTRYRPDPWRGPEWLVAASGLVALLLVLASGSFDPAGLRPSVSPLTWPPLPLLATAGVMAGLAAGFLSPPLPEPPS